MTKVTFVTYEGIQDITPTLALKRWPEDYCVSRPLIHGEYRTRFKKLLLSQLEEDSYYLFIISNEQLPSWEEHLKMYDFGKYEVYRNPCPVSNANYDRSARLHLRIFKFDSDFVTKWRTQ